MADVKRTFAGILGGSTEDVEKAARSLADAFRHVATPIVFLPAKVDALEHFKEAKRQGFQGERAKAWQHIGTLTPREANDHFRYLPKVLERQRGRKKGARSQKVEEVLPEVLRLIQEGQLPTRAARQTLKKLGYVDDKGTIDYLVKLSKAEVSR